ncbi:MAG: hypothetical protein QF752_16195 [Planctomycetota bacterium]|jgi:hypothetical protein|nr:hypothetical protein [Planctomycetota bacterium]
MQRIRTSNLLPTTRLNNHIFHESGELLLPSGEELTPLHKQKFLQLGIERVYLLDRFDSLVAFSLSQKNKYILVDELSAEHQVAAPICDEDGSIILGSQTVIDRSLREHLKSLGYYTVCVRKRQDELCLHQVEGYLNGVPSCSQDAPTPMKMLIASR